MKKPFKKFDQLKEHNLKLHLGKCWVFKSLGGVLGSHIYSSGLQVLKPNRLRPFNKFPNHIVVDCNPSSTCVIIIEGLLNDLIILLNFYVT
jgi:hypothetical protein